MYKIYTVQNTHRSIAENRGHRSDRARYIGKVVYLLVVFESPMVSVNILYSRFDIFFTRFI